MSEPKSVNWTREMLERFKIAYQKALKEQVKTFVFDGNQFYVGFAKYLIEYLDERL